MSILAVFHLIVLAALLGGGSAGLLGVFVMGLRIPFLAVCSAHAAMAGAVFGELMGFSHTISGFVGALAGAILLGWLLRKRNLDPNAALGTLFSLMLGLSFLGIGLMKGPKSGVLGLMWGSLLFVSPRQVVAMAVVFVVFMLLVWTFEKEIKALMFSRELASVLLPEGLMFGVFLLLVSAIIALNLEIVGGLLLFSLISNPAVAALKIAKGFRAVLVLSTVLGSVSALGGFAVAYWLDLPAGACIVLFSSCVVAWAGWVTRNT